VAVHSSAEIVENGIESLNNSNFCKNKKFKAKLSGIVGNSFLYKFCYFHKIISIGCGDIAFLLVGHFLLSHPVCAL